MEPILDVFSSDAFSFVALTDSINKRTGIGNLNRTIGGVSA